MTTQDYQTVLEPHRRGTEFRYHFTLGGGWTYTMFTGGLKFTLRKSLPPSSVTDDADAVDQATLAGGEITFSDLTSGTVLIPGSRTTSWPSGMKLFWDLQGEVLTGARVLDIDAGTVVINGDVTRSQG